MTSEIRVNKHTNRVGLGTIEYSNTGPVISGVTTASNFKTGSSNLHSSGVEVAGINVLGADTPIGLGATIYNSGAAVFTGVVTATTFSGSNINLSGVTTTTDHIHIKADNKQLRIGAHNDGDTLLYHDGNKSVLVNYTGDFHIRSNNGSRSSLEGIILKPNGATQIHHSGSKKLETASTGANVIGNLDVINGHVFINDSYELFCGTNNDLEIFHNDDDAYIRNNKGALILRNNGQTGDADASQIYIQATPAENSISCAPNGAVTLYNDNDPKLATNAAGVILYKDLDVDGHTNLDNVSISGITTFAQAAGAVTVPAGGDIRIANSGGWTGEYGGKIQHYSNFLYIQGGSNGIRFRYSDGHDRWVIGSGGHFDPGAAGSYDIGNTGNRVRQIYSTHANVSGISTLNSINVDGSAGINISYSGADLTMNSAGGIFTGNGGNATNPIVANVSDPNTGIFYPGADKLAVTTGGAERIRIEDGLITLFDSTSAYHKPTLKIANQSHGRYGGSLVFTAENSSGTEYTTARLRAYGGASDTGGQIGVGCGDFSGDGDKIRIFMDGKISISPTGNTTSYTNSFALTVIQTGGTNGYPGIHLKSLKSGGDEGMSFVATDDNWDLYTRAGNENGIGILRAGSAASSNARLYLAQGGRLTVGNAVYDRLSTSRKGHTMFHVVGGGVSVGCKGNTGTTAEGGRYVLGWYMVTHNTTNSYTHLITDLWAGGSPHGNNEYIMGGFHIHGHQYSGGASVGRERIYFHNWSGSYPGYSNSNPGNWSPGNTVYTHSTGYVALRLLGGSYRGYIIDLVQHAWYPTRDITVTSVVQSSSTTL